MARLRPFRPRALAGLAGLAVALLAGCSGSSSRGTPAASVGTLAASASASAPAPAPARPRSSAPPVLATASADEILAQARQALLEAGSVHVKGTVRTADVPYKLDLRMVRKVGATGSVAEQGTSLGVVRIKDVAYVQLDQNSWRAVTGSATTARQFAGKYLKVTASNG